MEHRLSGDGNVDSRGQRVGAQLAIVAIEHAEQRELLKQVRSVHLHGMHSKKGKRTTVTVVVTKHQTPTPNRMQQ